MSNVHPIPTAPQPPAGDEIKFAYWVPNVSGGLVISKIEQRTGWDYRLQPQAGADRRGERASTTR